LMFPSCAWMCCLGLSFVSYVLMQGMSSMVEAWISQANARQRGGRAGRVRPGNCFCLYTRHRLETLMRPFQVKSYLSSCLLKLRSMGGSPLQL
jgi:HrpA-like RNA helicase